MLFLKLLGSKMRAKSLVETTNFSLLTKLVLKCKARYFIISLLKILSNWRGVPSIVNYGNIRLGVTISVITTDTLDPVENLRIKLTYR